MAQRHEGPIPGPKESDPEWYSGKSMDGKGYCVGASNAAAACGVSPYKTALDVGLELLGKKQEEERSEEVEARLRRGRLFQPLMLDEYSREQKVEVLEPLRRYFHPTKPYMSCTPDGIATSLDGERYGIECKGTTPMMYAAMSAIETNKYGDDGTDVVPTDVLLQCQQQMEVMDWDRVDVVAFFGLFVMRVYPVNRSDEIIDAISTAEKELVERVQDGRLPEPDWTHPNTAQLVTSINGLVEGESIQLSSDAVAMWQRRDQISEVIKELEEEKRGLTNQVLHKLGSAEVGSLGNGKELRRVSVKDTTYTEADLAALKSKLGKTKRRGYERLIERKAK